MKEKEEGVAYGQEEEREPELSTNETPNQSRSPFPSDMTYFDCPIHGKVRGTSCPHSPCNNG